MNEGVDPKLAPNWRAGRVLDCLVKGRHAKKDLITFIAERHKARFFAPIKHLQGTPRLHKGRQGFGYGFAVMALCALLIETIQSYWEGLPSTNKRELSDLKKRTAPPEYAIPRADTWPKNNAKVFEKFFANPVFGPFFPDVNSSEFYKNIRNGLLHQAQTKGGWLLERSGPLWDGTNRKINRDLFAEAVEDAFDRYIQELRDRDWETERWRNARRKTWWLVELSKASG